MIDRRTFIRAAATAFAAARLDAFAQPAGRVYRVGILRPTSPPKSADRVTGEFMLPAALKNLGYVAGRNLIIEWRYAEGNVQRLPVLARGLVQMQVDLIVAIAGAAVQAAEEATATIPIIIYGNFDPVAAGFVASLARPGRNVTGVLIAPEGTLAAKKLELLTETVPRARRIAILAPEDPTSSTMQLPELQQAAGALGIELALVSVRDNNYADAFVRIVATRPDALFVLADTYFVLDRRSIIDLTIRHRLPAIWEWREQVEDGGLMAYGSRLSERYQRIAEYIDRIFRGANPGELPVDQPTKFELVLNLKTAKAIGLTITKAMLARADDVIQ
jgi:putative tryptophan/tyrosine transport system substrate-binding protein